MSPQPLPAKRADNDWMLFLTLFTAISVAGLEWVWPLLF